MLRKFHGALPGRIKKWLYVTLLVWPACILSPISRPHQPPSPSYSTFKTYGFKTKASKCQLFRKEVSYLGGLISSEGYRADPKNISTVQAKIKERSKTVTELRSTLGLIRYFRRSITNFSKLVQLLHILLKLCPENSGCPRPITTTSNYFPSNRIRWLWETLHFSYRCISKGTRMCTVPRTWQIKDTWLWEEIPL